MLRFFDNLRVQLALLIIVALILAQGVSLWLFVDERGLAVRAAVGFEAAGRAANVASLIEEAPTDLRPAILKAANSPLVRFDLSDGPVVNHNTYYDNGAVEARIRNLLGETQHREIRVELHKIDDGVLQMTNSAQEITETNLMALKRELSTIEMRLSIAVLDGRWLNVETRFERPPLQWAWMSFIGFGLTAATIMMVAFWFLLNRLTGPLLRISHSAEKLGRGEIVKPLALVGPSEVRNLTRTFNHMQDRLTRFVAGRTQLLAGLGHDLRSPLTVLRVRAEMVEDPETRDSLIKSIEEMQEMVSATLSFARGMANTESYEAVDFGAYLAQLRSDMMDEFALKTSGKVTVRIRPKSLRRAFRNIIENALRYGEIAEVTYWQDSNYVVMTVSDNGPGIADADREHVFEPFFRLEKSRSRETGGTGLGLSIARTIIRAHGGDISLSNQTSGGLIVTVKLPLATRPGVELRD